MNSRVMSQLLGLEFPGMDTGPQSTSTGHLVQPGLAIETSNRYAPVMTDSVSDSSPFTPDMQQWMQSYPEPSIPLSGYDFQSFT